MRDPQFASIEAVLAEYPRDGFRNRIRDELQRRIRVTTTLPGVREGFTTVTPYLTVVEAERLVEFAKAAFGAVETGRSTGSSGHLHCALRIGDSMLMCCGGEAVRGRERPLAPHLYVPDVRQPLVHSDALVRISAVGRDTDSHAIPASSDPLGLIEFLKEAFDAKELGVYKSPEGRVMHAALRTGDAIVEMGETTPMPASFYLYVQDADAVYRQAVEAGAKSVFAPADQPYGDHMGLVEDNWGNSWCTATHRSA